MSYKAFDAASYATFKLAKGSISTSDNKELTLIPLDILAACSPTSDMKNQVKRWGESWGEKLMEQMTDASSPLGMEALAQHLQSATSLMGLGKLTIDIRQGAFILVLKQKDNSCLKGAVVALFEHFCAGFLSSLSAPNQFSVAQIGIDDASLTCFAGNPTAVRKIETLVSTGTPMNAAIEALVEGGRE